MAQPIEARRLLVNGIVQGVGFRPFVYQLALRHGLTGEVANTSTGVSIDVEGPADRLDAFKDDLTAQPPPLAHIVAVDSRPEAVRACTEFRIAHSRADAAMATLISPDVAICPDCLRELFDPADRRYRYPFINCTNCGPRYTIIEDIPYDRPNTTMRHFPMCPDCRAEYDEPARPPLPRPAQRLPGLRAAAAGCTMRTAGEIETGDPIAAAAARLREGRIVAVKGLGGFHLAGDALNAAAVARLRQRKRREDKPFAVMVARPGRRTLVCARRRGGRGAARLVQRPIVLLPKRHPEPARRGGRAAATAARGRDAALHAAAPPAVAAGGSPPLVMTSGNLSEEPIAIDNDEALRAPGAASPTPSSCTTATSTLRCDDSVVRAWPARRRMLLRRARGYVPAPLVLPGVDCRRSWRCGAELKNTFCLTKGEHAFLSQHIGDLENLRRPSNLFEAIVDTSQRLFDDPSRRSSPTTCTRTTCRTRYARRASDLPEGRRAAPPRPHRQPAWPSTGSTGRSSASRSTAPATAPDGSDLGRRGAGRRLRRASSAPRHLRYVPMPGGAAAIREPWRMAVSVRCTTPTAPRSWGWTCPRCARPGSTGCKAMLEIARKRVNSPLTSSLGRLFDGVAALVGLRSRVSFEGQAAMELEMAAGGETDGAYPFAWEEGPPARILPAPIIRGVVDDVLRGVPVAAISARFHATLVRLFSDLAEGIGRRHHLQRVVLSGGVFQNSRLLSGLIPALTARGFEVYSHRLVPANDGGISLGQAVIAAHAA